MILAKELSKALILSGGGARGAYQAGVIKCISEIAGDNLKSPFNIITGYPSETFDDFLYTYNFIKKHMENPHFSAGMNSFFIPNKFPKERYNISLDRNGFWQSDIVNIYDRYTRVQAIRKLYQDKGLDPLRIYFHESVEGILLDKKLELDIYDGKAENQYINLYNAPQLLKKRHARILNDWNRLWSDISSKSQKIALFPAGNHTTWLMQWLQQWEFSSSVCTIIDDHAPVGKEIAGIKVVKPEEIHMTPEVIVLSSDTHLDALKQRLKTFENIHQIEVIYPYNFFSPSIDIKPGADEFDYVNQEFR